MFRMIALGVVAFGAIPALASTNIVNDPGFESAPAPAGFYNIYGSGATFGGWTVAGTDSGNSGLTVHTTYGETGVLFNANSGTTSYDLTAAGNTGFNAVFQNLTTLAGKKYNVSFWLGNASGNNNYLLPSSVALQIDGGLGELFTNGNVTANRINWQRFTTNFTATGTSTDFRFVNATPGTDNFAGLDDISVSAVPEPSTWLTMILGFGTIGAALRRRRQTAALA
jgi:hypothetical protein